jgi:hypothetical protein
MLQYTQNLFEHDRIWKQAKLILIRLNYYFRDVEIYTFSYKYMYNI